MRVPTLTKALISTGALMAALLATSAASAQTPSGQPSREALNPAVRAVQPTAQADLFSAPEPGPCIFGDSQLTLTLQSVTFTGLTAYPPEELRPAYGEFIGKEGPISNLCTVRDRVSRLLYEKGLLARVQIPEQRIAGGVLALEVIEARIVNVRVRGDAGPATPLVEGYARKLRGLTPFDLNVAQRYLLLASDVPGLRVRAAVRPNPSGERGAVDLDLTVVRDPLDILVNVQNHQPEASGRWGGLMRVDFQSFTRFGERTSLVGYHTLGSGEQWVVQALEEIRLGSEGWIGRASLAYGRGEPGAALAPLDLETESFIGGIEAAYPLMRLRRQNLNLAGGLEIADQTTDLGGGGGTLIEDHLRVVYARIDGDYQARWRGTWGPRLQGGLTLRKGLSGLGASELGDPNTSRIEGDPEAFVVRGASQIIVPVSPWFSLAARLEGQWADSPLLAYEEYSAGNLTIGRGYDPGVVSGDKAIAAALEARIAPLKLPHGALVAPYVFYDTVRLDNLDVGGGRTDVASYGGGLQVRLTQRVMLDVAYAQPLDPVTPGGSRPHPWLLLSLTASLH